MSRRVGFFAAILIGIVLGLVYGWVINPVKYYDTFPNTLRADYKTDMVLMVAEIYRVEGDLSLAARRLAQLGSEPPVEIARQAQQDARRDGFSSSDQSLIDTLVLALSGPTPVPALPTSRGTP